MHTVACTYPISSISAPLLTTFCVNVYVQPVIKLRNLCVLAQKRQFQMYVCVFYLHMALYGGVAILIVDINYIFTCIIA